MKDKYGVKLFEEMVEILWKNRNAELRDETYGYNFDYPDYGGLPKRISNRLSGEAVDRIQDELCFPDDLFKSKAVFKRKMRELLFLLA